MGATKMESALQQMALLRHLQGFFGVEISTSIYGKEKDFLQKGRI